MVGLRVMGIGMDYMEDLEQCYIHPISIPSIVFLRHLCFAALCLCNLCSILLGQLQIVETGKSYLDHIAYLCQYQ